MQLPRLTEIAGDGQGLDWPKFGLRPSQEPCAKPATINAPANSVTVSTTVNTGVTIFPKLSRASVDCCPNGPFCSGLFSTIAQP